MIYCLFGHYETFDIRATKHIKKKQLEFNSNSFNMFLLRVLLHEDLANRYDKVQVHAKNLIPGVFYFLRCFISNYF